MIRVKFIEVGRGKKSWEASYNGNTDDLEVWLRKQVRPFILSPHIEFSESGYIFAGMRMVGRFEIGGEHDE